MINLIQQIDDWQNKTPEQIAELLNTPSVERRDDQLYTWAGVALVAGPEAAEMLRVALEQNGMGWVVHQLGGSGIQLSNDMVQQVLYQFAQAGIPNMEQLALVGKSIVSPAEKAGLGTVTTEQVQAELVAEQARETYRALQRLRRQWDELSQTLRHEIETGVTTSEQVVSRVQELWGE